MHWLQDYLATANGRLYIYVASVYFFALLLAPRHGDKFEWREWVGLFVLALITPVVAILIKNGK